MKKRRFIILFIISFWAGSVYAAIAMINSLNTGEVTGEIAGRTDVKKYYSACRILENFNCEPYGGISKRPGTYYISEAADQNAAGRIITFQRSTTESIILEFSNETIQFYK
jgi:hypothetical protein